jgi:probable phosphoglycerate mutase
MGYCIYLGVMRQQWKLQCTLQAKKSVNMFYIVRHGLTDYYMQNICQSQENNPINEIGVVQANELADRIGKMKFRHFISSDLQRAKQTAEIVNKKLKMEISYDQRLRERLTGIFGGKLKDNISNEIQNDAIENAHKYGGETYEDIYKRVKSFYDEMKSKRIDNTLVMAHSGSIRMLRYIAGGNKWHNEPYKEFLSTLKPINPTEVFELDFYNR